MFPFITQRSQASSCYFRKDWFPAEMPRSQILGSLVLTQLLGTLVLSMEGLNPHCVYSVSVYMPSQSNKVSPSIRDHVDTLEAVGQEIRSCLEPFTAFIVYRGKGLILFKGATFSSL